MRQCFVRVSKRSVMGKDFVFRTLCFPVLGNLSCVFFPPCLFGVSFRIAVQKRGERRDW